LIRERSPSSYGFVDGNKRVSAVVAELLLDLNGYTLAAEDTEIVQLGSHWRQAK